MKGTRPTIAVPQPMTDSRDSYLGGIRGWFEAVTSRGWRSRGSPWMPERGDAFTRTIVRFDAEARADARAWTFPKTLVCMLILQVYEGGA